MATRRKQPKRFISKDDSNETIFKDKEFETITKAFFFTGVTFVSFKTYFSLKGVLIAFSDVISLVLCGYFIAGNTFITSVKSQRSAGHAFISAFASLISICLRLIILSKRIRILKCMEFIAKLNRDMFLQETDTDSKRLRRYAWIGCSFSILFPVLMMIFGLVADDYCNSAKQFHAMFHFQFNTPKNLSTTQTILVFFLRILNVLVFKTVPLLTLTMCTFVFTRLRNINQSFLSMLQKSMELNMPSKLFSDYTVLYGKITKTIEKVEKTFSLISFFLYGYMLSTVFSITSHMVGKTSHAMNVWSILYQVITFVETVACFIFLSMRAAGVNESAVEVKNIIHSLPAKRFDFDPNLTATLLQLANNFANEVCVTGWGLFTINRGFILTTAGVVVTYGVILVQLGS